MGLYDSPIPGVAIYGQQAALAKTAYQNALARLNQRRSGTLRKYGFKADIDKDSGVVRNLQTDASNPYGMFQEANRSQALRADAAQEDSLARGLGRGGLAAQRQTMLRHDFGREDAEIGTGLTEALGGFQDEQNQAAYQRDSALYESELAATRAAIESQQFNQADFSGLQYPQPGQDPIAAKAAQLAKKVTTKKRAPLGGPPDPWQAQFFRR